MLWDVVIVKYGLDQVGMDFAKCILEIKEGDNNRALSNSCFINNISHLRSMFQGTR